MAPTQPAPPPKPSLRRQEALALGPNSPELAAPKPWEFRGVAVLVMALALPPVAKIPPMQWPGAEAPGGAIKCCASVDSKMRPISAADGRVEKTATLTCQPSRPAP